MISSSTSTSSGLSVALPFLFALRKDVAESMARMSEAQQPMSSEGGGRGEGKGQEREEEGHALGRKEKISVTVT